MCAHGTPGTSLGRKSSWGCCIRADPRHTPLESTWCWLQPAAVQELAFALQSFAFLFAFLKAQGIYHLWQRWFSDLQGGSKPSPVIFCLVYQCDFYKGPPRATEDCSLGADATSLPAAGTGGHSLARGQLLPVPRIPATPVWLLG